MTFKSRVLLWGVGLVAIGSLGYWIFFKPFDSTTAQNRHAQNVPVVTAQAHQGSIDVTFNALGTVTPLATVTVRTQINGKLTQVAFQEGQMVHEGDFIAEIDPRPYELALKQDEGQLIRDEGLLKDAETDLARYKKLMAEDSIARQQLDAQVALVQQYRGTVVVDQAQIDSAKLNLVYCHITAPVTGRIGLRQVDLGNYVQSSDSNGIAVITEMQPISVLFTLPEDNLPLIMQRLASGATLTVNAYDRDRSLKLATGKLIAVDSQIDPTTGTIKLRAQFDNADGKLFPNQFVNVELIADTLSDAIIIPNAAVLRGAKGTYVYVVTPEKTAEMRPIKLGQAQDENIAVISGLAAGDTVVAQGADKLRDGAPITLPNTAGDDTSSKHGTQADATSPPGDKPAAPDGEKPAHQHHHKDNP